MSSSIMFGLLALAIIIPLYNVSGTEDTEAATSYNEASITLTSSSTTATITADATTLGSSSTAFISSDLSTTSQYASYSITTTNATGYTIGIATNASDTSTSLTSGSNTLSSLAYDDTTKNGLSASDYTNADTTSYNNTWALYPGTVGGSTNSKFYPISSNTITMGTTTAANSTATTYKVGLAARITMDQASGTYTTTASNFKVTAVGNAASYSITYNANGGDVSTLPSPNPQSSASHSQSYVTLSSITPTKTGYDFIGWCTAQTNDQTSVSSDSTACTNAGGTYYAAGGTFYIDETTKNITILYAVWERATYTVTFKTVNATEIVLNGVTYTNNQTTNIPIGTYNITGTIPTGYKFSSWSRADGVAVANANTLATTMTVSGAGTLTLNGAPNTYDLVISGDSNVTAVSVKKGSTSGTETSCSKSSLTFTCSSLAYGTRYYLYPTFSPGHTFSSWAKTDSATNATLGSTGTMNTYYTMGAGAGALTLTSESCSTLTFKTSDASGIVFNGTNYTNDQTVCIANGTYSIYGTYATKYAWQSWSATAGSFGNSSYQNTTYTVAGDATITLTGQSVALAMQNLSSSNCTTTARPVYDIRDDSVYWVQQLADGKCWMLDNLGLDLTRSTIVNTLSTSNTNLDTTALSYFKNGGGTASDRYPIEAYTNWTTSYSYSRPMIKANIKDEVLVSMDAPTTPNHKNGAYGPGQNKVGAYYNYCAASVGYYCYGNGRQVPGSSSGDNTYDICPAGWKMPTGGSSGEYNALYTNSAIGSDAAAYRTALSTSLAGYYSNGSIVQRSSDGYFWSSTWYSNSSMYSPRVDSSNVDQTNTRTRNGGLSIRCILIPTMQTVATSNVDEGEEVFLIDSRDNQIYTVKKINGQLWMTRNLAIGCNGSGSSYGGSVSSKSLTSADSNVSDSWSTPTALLSTKANSSSTSGYTTPAMQCSSTYGAWYNYAAATAGTITGSSNSTAATKDICPAGWHLPTGPNTTSGTDFNKLVGNTTGGWQAVTTGLTAFSAVAGSYYVSGSLKNNGYEYWWSATANSTAYRYILGHSSSSGQFRGNDSLLQYYGFYVRCVRS